MPQIKSHQTSVLQCYSKTWDQFPNLKSKFFHLPYTNVKREEERREVRENLERKVFLSHLFMLLQTSRFFESTLDNTWLFWKDQARVLSEGCLWGVWGEDVVEQCPVVICIDLSPIFVQHCRRTFSTRHCIDQSPKSSLTWPDDLLDNKRNLYGCLLSERQSTTNPIKQYEKIVKW